MAESPWYLLLWWSELRINSDDISPFAQSNVDASTDFYKNLSGSDWTSGHRCSGGRLGQVGAEAGSGRVRSGWDDENEEMDLEILVLLDWKSSFLRDKNDCTTLFNILTHTSQHYCSLFILLTQTTQTRFATERKQTSYKQWRYKSRDSVSHWVSSCHQLHYVQKHQVIEPTAVLLVNASPHIVSLVISFDKFTCLIEQGRAARDTRVEQKCQCSSLMLHIAATCFLSVWHHEVASSQYKAHCEKSKVAIKKNVSSV